MANTTGANPHGSANPQEAQVLIGRITGKWGLHGDLKVEVLTDFTERFSPGSILYLDGQPARVERSRSFKAGFLVKLDLVNDRTEAELQRGRSVTIPQREVKPLPEGSFYHFQIVDIDVWNEKGEYLGKVKEILSTGSNDVYVVRGESRKEILVPALEEVVLDVNLQDSRMTVRLPQGLS